MITNINTGVCHRRIQEGKPSFFVNWQEDGKQNYEFFSVRFMCETFKRQLEKKAEQQKEVYGKV
jgi:hypothetical protein